MDKLSLGSYISGERRRQRLSLTELSERADVSKSHLSQIENGKIALPNAEIRRRIADALGVQHMDLLIAAGELTPDEVPKPGAPRDPFPSSDVRAQLVALMREEDPSSPVLLGFLEVLQRLHPSKEPEKR